MPPAKGFVQINFQIPEKLTEKLDSECKNLRMKRGEFLTRLLTMYYLMKELGMASDVFDFFKTGADHDDDHEKS